MTQEQRKSELPQLSIVEYALSYAQKGWSVFPLHGKYPFKEFHWKEEATTDLEKIALWWTTTYQRANIGLLTGSVSGVIVLDIDPRNAEKANPNPYRVLEERFGKLPETRTVRTAHGGVHKYFQHPQNGAILPNRVKLAGIPGADFRGDGGYVVLPPSSLFNRLFYTWADPDTPIAQAPDWLLALFTNQQGEREYPAPLRFASTPGEKWLRQALERVTPGTRNDTGFQLAIQLRDEGLSKAEARSVLMRFARSVPQPPGRKPYTIQEALKSVDSAYSREKRPPARRI